MADPHCPKCQGAGRIPWFEAGMMQDCDCVRAARARATVADPELPLGWRWQGPKDGYGWWVQRVDRPAVHAWIYRNAGFNFSGSIDVPLQVVLRDAIRARNALLTPSPDTGSRSP